MGVYQMAIELKMNTREKLIELLEEAEGLVNNDVPSLEQIADHLIAHGVTIQKWIPVTERLPDVNKFVLVYGEGIVGEATRDGTDGKFYWAGSDEYCSAIDVTHWMPLPSPPKGE